jgi:DNA-binding NarL/FixJ family response regulator
MEPRVTAPLSIALIDDYDIVVMGIAHILEQYRDRVVIAELDTNKDVSDMVDIVLYDSFAHHRIEPWRGGP